MPNVVEALNDPKLLGKALRQPETFAAWMTFTRALFALPLAEDELALYRECTGRDAAPIEPAREGWLIVGRRGGKSFVLALIAVYLACFRDYSNHLAPGERGVVMVIAADRKQARVIFRYVKALLNVSSMLRARCAHATQEMIDLTNGISIEIHTCSFRSVRGYTVVAALLDEVAVWRDERSANPDVEVLASIKPAMLTIPGAVMLCASSPYSKRGALWEAHRDHYGVDGDVLVWQATTRSMNPTVPQSAIDREYAKDPARAAAEYGAEFRNDLEAFLDDELVRSLVRAQLELPPQPNLRYHAFADPSGGRGDAFTLAVAHQEKDRVIVDCLRATSPPFDPESVAASYCDLLKQYGLSRVVGDRYAAEWVTRAFKKHGVEYRASERTKSQIYVEALPLFTRAAIELPDDPRLITELAMLERQTTQSGDKVDHPRGAHDDRANAVCGAAVEASGTRLETWSPTDPRVQAALEPIEQNTWAAVNPWR